MGLLVNIDNGGTLTDVCVFEGDQVWRTKTLTTPDDLSRCLIDGLTKISHEIFGEDDIERLLLATDHLRYSTTQGTNALIQRKGPRLGLLYGGALDLDTLRNANAELFDALVGDRTANIENTANMAVRAVADLGARGANRVVVSVGGPERHEAERALKRALLRAFPAQLLGALPLLYGHELTSDDDDVRRTWTALFNAFLHPAMERFLYAAEHRLREARAQRPLLIFCNDGHSARVAKTTAVRTYSSGPRGGAEGACQLARHYGFDPLISIDIGGTTTDISVVEGGTPRARNRGRIADVETSFALTDVLSIGVGGSSILKVAGDRITVGPESVGSAPGPACFGFGGTEATMTDAFFASGLLDPASFFAGSMKIDVERARRAVTTRIGEPLGLGEHEAIEAMEHAWVASVADGVARYVKVDPSAVIAAFGGAGPFVICRIADAIGVQRVIIPKLAAVFSAFGIGFSDIGHEYSALPGDDHAATLAGLTARARRGMAAEGVDPADCQETSGMADGELRLKITMALPRPVLSGNFSGATTVAQTGLSRTLLGEEVALYRVADLAANCTFSGPAILEDDFYTARIDVGWTARINSPGDILLERSVS